MEIRDVSEGSLGDLLAVCSGEARESTLRAGVEIKRKWLARMLRDRGACAKIAYMNGKPVAQVLYWPESASPLIEGGRSDVLYLNCVFNPAKPLRGMDVGTLPPTTQLQPDQEVFLRFIRKNIRLFDGKTGEAVV